MTLHKITWSEDDFVIKSKYHHFTFISCITQILSLQDGIIFQNMFYLGRVQYIKIGGMQGLLEYQRMLIIAYQCLEAEDLPKAFKSLSVMTVLSVRTSKYCLELRLGILLLFPQT